MWVFAAGAAETKPYSDFGNFSIGDCGYETDANLILHEYPKAKITTDEVESAYDNLGNLFAGTDVTTDGGEIWTAQGLWTAQNYLISTGFDGHRASSITQVFTLGQEVAAANGGGLQVVVTGPTLMHVFGVIHANAKELTQLDDGTITHLTWSWLLFSYTHAFGPDMTQTNPDWVSSGETLAFYAVKWSA